MKAGSGGITYLDGRRLSRSLLAAADWVDARRDELNRINVFPVPDGDTGSNFAMTLRAGAEAARPLGGEPLPAVAHAAAEGCMFSARGNSGLLLSQFFLGFCESIGASETLDTVGLALAVKAGADQLGAALDQPVEGTILTVSRDVAAAAQIAAAGTNRHDQLLRGMLQSGQESLSRTPQLLGALKAAGVVDAGAKAFVLTIEGVVRLLDGQLAERPAPIDTTEAPFAAARASVATERDFGFCTEVLVRSSSLPAAAMVRAALRPLGGSIVVLSSGGALKVHVHTDSPGKVFELAARWGTVEKTKAEDVRAQHRALAERKDGVTVVVDSSSDLTGPSLSRYGIELVPIQVIVGNKAYLDGVDLQPGDIYEMARTSREPLTTSQPAPGAWVRAFQDARGTGAQVFCLTISGALSGTYTSAQAAARSVGDGVMVFDSRTVSLGLGMLAIRGAELAALGWAPEAIATELRRIREQSSGFFTVDTFDQLLRSGRVSRARAWLGSLLNLKPILEIDQSGQVAPLERVRGRAALVRRVMEHLERRLTPRPRRLRLGVVHASVDAVAMALRDELVRRFQPSECLVSPITSAIGVHTGPGAWGVFYQVEDPSGN